MPLPLRNHPVAAPPHPNLLYPVPLLPLAAELMLTGFNDPSPESAKGKDVASKSFGADGETLQTSMARLAELVGRAHEYVEAVAVSDSVAWAGGGGEWREGSGEGW